MFSGGMVERLTRLRRSRKASIARLSETRGTSVAAPTKPWAWLCCVV